MTGLLLLLIVLMIVGALIALESRDLLSAIICIGSVGFLAAMVFLLLGAPDLAITQIAVTHGPGLAGCLALGIAFAKSLALAWAWLRSATCFRVV